MDLKSKAMAGGWWNLLASILQFGLQLIKNLVVIRMLAPEDMGLFAMLAIFLAVADSFADAGLSAGIVQKQTIDRKVLSSLFWFNIMAGLLVFFAMLALTPSVVTYYSEPRLGPLGMTLFTGILLRSLGKQFEMNLMRDLDFRAIAIAETISDAIGLVMAIVLAAMGFGAWALVLSLIVSALFRSGILMVRHWHNYKPELHFAWNDVRPYLRFGGFQMAETMVRFFAQRIDVLLLGRWMGATTLGLYNFGVQTISIPIQRVNPIVTRVAFPLFSKIQGDQVTLRRSYLRAVRMLCVVNAFFLVVIAATSPWLVPLVFGPKWALAVPYVQLASLLGFMRSAGNPSGSLLMALGRTDIGFIQNIVLAVANIPMVWVGMHFFGGVGVLCALILVQILLHVPIYSLVYRRFLGPCARDFFLASLRPLLVSIPAFLLGSMAGRLVPGASMAASVYGILLAGSVSMAVFCCGTWLVDRPTVLDVLQIVRRRRECSNGG